MYYTPSQENARTAEIGKLFQDFLQNLEKYQVEYDLGSENIFKNKGRVNGKQFIVGECRYNLIILPPGLENLDQFTVKLIEEYLTSGGTILSFGDVPGYVDGASTYRVKTLSTHFYKQWIRVKTIADKNALDLLCCQDFRILEPEIITGKLFHHRRQLDDGQLLFLVNTSLENTSAGTCVIQGKSVRELDLKTGEIKPYPVEFKNGAFNLSFLLPPSGSLMLFIGHDAGSQPSKEKKQAELNSLPANGLIQQQRTSANVLPLDYCTLKLGNHEIKDIYFYAAADTIFKYYGFSGNPWNRAVQYKTSILDKNNFSTDSGFEASYSFIVDSSVDVSTLRAVVERPHLWKVTVNGADVVPLPGEWWLDRSFGVFDIGSHVVSGTNIFTLTARPMTIHSELEPVYILGDFGLEAHAKGWKLVRPFSRLFSEWKKQGMPFYADGVSYRNTYKLEKGKYYKVCLSQWYGSVAEVRVNGSDAGIISWLPYELDITPYLNNGNNEIEVIVYGTLKNLLGPHHCNPPHGSAWPGMFEQALVSQPPGEEYDTIGYGLFEAFSIWEYRE
jgi:hypothetical protein